MSNVAHKEIVDEAPPMADAEPRPAPQPSIAHVAADNDGTHVMKPVPRITIHAFASSLRRVAPFSGPARTVVSPRRI